MLTQASLHPHQEPSLLPGSGSLLEVRLEYGVLLSPHLYGFEDVCSRKLEEGGRAEYIAQITPNLSVSKYRNRGCWPRAEAGKLQPMSQTTFCTTFKIGLALKGGKGRGWGIEGNVL